MNKESINKIVDFLKNIENINYQWTLNGSSNARLSCVSLFCKLALIFKKYHKFNINKLVDIIKTYKNSSTYYVDGTKRKTDIIAETRQAISGLINSGYSDVDIDTDRYFDHDNLWFMTDKEWRNPWGAGAQLSHYLFFLKLTNDQERIDSVLEQLKKYEKHNGWYSVKPRENVRINGIMKVFTGLDIIDYDYENIRSIVERVCNDMLKKNPHRGGCNIYDYVYVLSKGVKINYKVEEIKSKLIKIGNSVLEYQHEDGGFSYQKDKTTTKIYGKRITDGKAQGGIHGTTLMCMSFAIIDKCCDLGLNLNLPIS